MNLILKLNDIRTVSVNRILYQQNGVIPPSCTTYKQIEKLVVQKFFPSFAYDFARLEQNVNALESKQQESESAIQQLMAENEALKAEIAKLTTALTLLSG